MAQKIEVKLIDDLDGSEATETVEFGFEGVDYVIDLNGDNAAKLRDALALYSAHARKVSVRKARAKGTATPKNTDAQKMREWIRSQGHEVADRGRIPNEWVEKYHTAQNAPQKAVQAPEQAPVVEAPKKPARKPAAKKETGPTGLAKLLKFEEPKPVADKPKRTPRTTTTRKPKSTTS
jgi:hypothetical protein